ncbi:hypothetical protein GCM10011381_38370 [Klenkia taihuensis]|nr:hypothetical protein GCM10011381_38370 [Klenkia taihuensis]
MRGSPAVRTASRAAQRGVKDASRPGATGPAAPSVADRVGPVRSRSRRREKATTVTDVVYVLLTLAVFGLLALAVRGVERL